jgi:hypothetical protein
MPFVQVIDVPEMSSWFASHFQVLSKYSSELIVKSPASFILAVSLTPEHVQRTIKKVMLFGDLMSRKNWVLPTVIIVHLFS